MVYAMTHPGQRGAEVHKALPVAENFDTRGPENEGHLTFKVNEAS
jgi:hypothetical protein